MNDVLALILVIFGVSALIDHDNVGAVAMLAAAAMNVWAGGED